MINSDNFETSPQVETDKLLDLAIDTRKNKAGSIGPLVLAQNCAEPNSVKGKVINIYTGTYRKKRMQ